MRRAICCGLLAAAHLASAEPRQPAPARAAPLQAQDQEIEALEREVERLRVRGEELQQAISQLDRVSREDAERIALLEQNAREEAARLEDAREDPGRRSAWLGEAQARLAAAASSLALGSTDGVDRSLLRARDLLSTSGEHAAAHGSAPEARLAAAAAEWLGSVGEALGRSDLFQARERLAPALAYAIGALVLARTLAASVEGAAAPAAGAEGAAYSSY